MIGVEEQEISAQLFEELSKYKIDSRKRSSYSFGEQLGQNGAIS